MKKVIITGGIGYIGSHTTVEFLNAGFEVVIIDNLANSRIEVLSGIEKICGKKPIFYQKDITEELSVKEVLKIHKDAVSVIHFAAYKSVFESVKQPLKYYHNNIQGLVNILQSMQEFGISNMVFSSSCTVYGQPEQLPITEETMVKRPESPYGNTKKINEEIIEDFVKSNSKANCISLRYFNPIGAHPSAEIGELPLGIPDNLLPYITQTAIGLRKELSVFGDDYNTPDGTAIRDYIDVVDLAKSHVVALKRMIDKNNTNRYEVFNIGTGVGISVMEIINTFEKVSKQKLKYKVVDRREGDIEKIWADTGKANNILGWKSEKSLEETILSAWNWQKKNNI